MLYIPNKRLWLRFAVILYVISLLIWMSLEDTQVTTVTILGSIGAGLIYIFWVLRKFGGQVLSRNAVMLLGILGGGLIGAGSVLLTAILMFFKSTWHSHILWDYPPPMILDMLQRIPIWALAGMLIGSALVLFVLAFSPTRKLPD